MRAVSDSETDPLSSLLSSFALGPAWARGDSAKKEGKPKSFPGEGRPPRRDDQGRGPRQGGPPRDRDGGDNRNFRGRDSRDDRRDGPQRQEEVGPEEGVRVTIVPDPHAVHLIGKEVHQVARVYALFDVAKILLAEKSRCRAVYEAPEPHAPLIRGKLEESLFLSRDEAVQHLWNSPLREELIEEETIEVEPPTGNFQAIARCGISGEWLGPVNFHSYQTNLRRLHRERFSRMPFELYASKVRTERGEEAVNAWLETMKKKTRWRIKGDDEEAWLGDRAEAERALATRCFDKAYEETRMAEVSGAIPAKNLSPSLLTSLRLSGSHARQHPAILIPSVCRAVEAEHLPVFKRQGKLHTGPARPHPLPPNAVLAERPGIMVAWIRENSPAKLEGLWKAVLPEGSTAPPADYAADLFWLLHQGHILLYTDDTLVVQETREATQPGTTGEGKKAKKKKKKKTGEGGAAIAGAASAEEESTTGEDESGEEPVTDAKSVAHAEATPAAEVPVQEAPAVEEAPPVEEAPAVEDAPAVEEPAPEPAPEPEPPSTSSAPEAIPSSESEPEPDFSGAPVGEEAPEPAAPSPVGDEATREEKPHFTD